MLGLLDLPSSSDSFASSFDGIVVSILILTFLFCCWLVSSFFFCLNILLIVVCCCAVLDGREVGIISLILSGLRVFGGLGFIDTGEGSASVALPLRQNFGLHLSCSYYTRLGLLF